MGDVIRLADIKKKQAPVVERVEAPEPDAEHYFCMRCDSDQFRLYAKGEVHCAKCGSLMANLCTGETGK